MARFELVSHAKISNDEKETNETEFVKNIVNHENRAVSVRKLRIGARKCRFTPSDGNPILNLMTF